MAEGGAPPGVNMAAITSANSAFSGNQGGDDTSTDWKDMLTMTFGFRWRGNGLPNLSPTNAAIFSKPVAYSPFTLTGKFWNFTGGKKTKPLKPSDLGVFAGKGAGSGSPEIGMA